MNESTNSLSSNSAEDKDETLTLENFIHQDGGLYSFQEKRHHELFNHLLKKRIYNDSWLEKAQKTHFLVILQAIRLLTRDNTILQNQDVEQFSENIFDILASKISKKTAIHSNEEDSSQDIIVELISISRRLITPGYLSQNDLEFTLKKIYEQGLFIQILSLIETTHHILLRCALEFLVILYDTSTELGDDFKEMYVHEFEDIHYLSQILIIIESYQSEYKALAVNLLSKLVESEKVVNLTKKCFGFTIILNMLNSASEYNTRIAILHLIKVLLQNEDNISELRALGLINLLLLMLRKSKNLFERILILTSLHLASHEPEASIKLHDLGINTLLRELLDIHPMRRNDAAFDDISEGDTDDLIKNYSLYLFRTIRSVFALERNRKVIKQVFPPRLFALFVDVGNYVNELENYAPVYKEFVNMPNKEFEILEKAIMDISNIVIANDNTNKFRKIRSYTLIQQIGKGAFGTVYLGRKGDHEYILLPHFLNNIRSRFAIKELRIADFEIPHNSHRKDINLQAESISKEVRIYKELSHPHVIKYYESFIEEDYVYIVMEYIDGFSLLDLIKLQAEKNNPFKENQIWTVVISLCGVLKYLHQEKSVIHRDLNPSNILIDRTFRVKLADFGLARKLTQSTSNLKAFVGTLGYTSPEVVENKPYTEKADIWSLGCLIYELIALKQPFYSANPLMLAKKIVENSYERITDSPYSPKLLEFMRLCMTPEPDRRPGIRELIQLISEQILDFTHRVLEYEDHLKLQIVSLKKKGREIETKGESVDSIKAKLIKIDNHDLVKMKQDPVSNFIEVLRKLGMIVSAKELGSLKRDLKKYLIELFYKRMVTNPKVSSSALRQELNKILTFSKEEMSIFKEVEFSQDTTANDQFLMTGGITYEKFYFFIEEKLKALNQQA